MDRQIDVIRAALDVMCEEGCVYELRALNVPTGGDWTSTFSGYFDDLEALAGAAVNLDRRCARGVYVTPNPVKPDLLARRNNKAKRCRKRDPLTKNGEIERRRWLLLDFDPERPAGISSTAEELEAARGRAIEVARYLKSEGWPGGVLAESGNGAHLLYRVDLPAEDEGLTKRVLQAIAERSTGDGVEVDTGVHNPARIWKLYGTTARKGDATEERPHRRARILKVADALEVVPTMRLQALAGAAETRSKAHANHSPGASGSGTGGHSDSLSEEEVRRALSFIPPRPAYGDWFQISAAVYDAIGGDARHAERLLKAWSGEEEEGEYRRILESDLNGSITAGTLIHEAQRHGYELPAKRNEQRNFSKRNGQHPPKPPNMKCGAGKPPVAGVLASDVEKQPIRWIWPGRLARGEMTILDGDPGLGKSTLLCDLAARLTTGRPLPGEDAPLRDGPGGVVLVTTEDSPSHTIRPRLDAAGADPQRVRIVQTVPTRDDEGGWNGGEAVPKLPDDLDVLKVTCASVDADLLVIDPLLAHLSGEVNTFKDGDVRSALAPVQAFAEKAGLAVVVVRHLTKGSAGANPLYRGQASIGIIGAARLAFAFGEDPENAGHLVLAPNKVNLGKKPPALKLCLEDSPDVGEVARVKWLGTSALSAHDLFSAKQSEADSPALSEAKDFLHERLSAGPQPASEMYDAAEEAGIKKDTLKRARREIATSERTGGVGGGGHWQWILKESEKPLSVAYTNDTILRGETDKKKANKGAKSAFEANWPKNGMASDATLSEPKNGTSENDPAEDIEEGGEAVHTLTGKRVTVRGLRSRVAHIADDDGNKLTVGRADLKPITNTDEVPF